MAGYRPRRFWLALLAAGGIAVSLPPVASGTFPGRNGRIAYEQVRTGGAKIVSVLPNGTRRNTLLARLGAKPGHFGGPVYSPHGHKLAFSFGRSATGCTSLYVVRANGRGRRRRLTHSCPGASDFGPAWAPDGRRLGFIRSSVGSIGIRLYRAGRSRGIDGEADHLAWSVRGQLAISRSPGGSAFNPESIYTMRSDGSDMRFVVDGEQPDWSPHGHWIVYRTPAWPGGIGAPPQPPGFTQGIALIRPDGSNQHVLTNDGTQPAFSPDGKYIVFSRFDEVSHRSTLVVMRLRDQRTRSIATGATELGSPAWQPLPRRAHR